MELVIVAEVVFKDIEDNIKSSRTAVIMKATYDTTFREVQDYVDTELQSTLCISDNFICSCIKSITTYSTLD